MSGPISICCCDPPGSAEFKLVVALVTWMGRIGFDTRVDGVCVDTDEQEWLDQPCAPNCNSYIPYSASPPPHKWLGSRLRVTWTGVVSTKQYCLGALTTEDTYAWVYERDWDTHTDRYTGVTTTVSDVETWDSAHDTLSGGISDHTEEHFTGDAAQYAYNLENPPYLDTANVNGVCGHILPPEPEADGWTVITMAISDNEIEIHVERDVPTSNTIPDCDGFGATGSQVGVDIGSYRLTLSLYDKFTNAEVYAMGKELLAVWDLADDTHYPWRTSCSGEGYRIGALVQHDYGGGLFGVPGAVVGGPYSGETWDSGDHSLLGYAVEGMSGGSAYYEKGTNLWNWPPGSLILAKWAEKKIALPGHNYARPCGDDYYATETLPPISTTALCWPPGYPTNVLTSNNTNVTAGDWVTIGSKSYTWQSPAAIEGDVTIGGSADASLLNLIRAINHTGTPGTDYVCAAAHPEVSAGASVTSHSITVTGLVTATLYGDLYDCTTGGTGGTLTWSHSKLSGPDCAAPCNTAASNDDFTTIERTSNYRARGEGLRFNAQNDNAATECPETYCDGDDVTVPVAWSNDCTQRNETTGTILYCSPNTETFGGSTASYSFPATFDSDDAYGNLWQLHIRQAMPDPLGTCAGLYATPADVLLEEARCDEGTCPALISTPPTPVHYCLDSSVTCGFQDDYGMQCPPV